MTAEISPVKAPSRSQWTFWAATPISVPARSCTAADSETYGGQTTTSTPSKLRSLSSRQNSTVSPGPLNIFQLPAMSTRRILRAVVPRGDGRDTRELLPLQELERGATPDRDPGDPVGQSRLRHRADRVAAADDRIGPRVRDRLCHRSRALGEPGPLEDAHPAVPEDRPRDGDPFRQRRPRLRADVEPEPPFGHALEPRDPRLRLGV